MEKEPILRQIAKRKPRQIAGFSDRKATKKWSAKTKSFSPKAQNQLYRVKITCNCDIFGVNEFLSITKFADFILNIDVLSLVSKRFFQTDFVPF